MGQGHFDVLAGHRVQPAEHARAGRRAVGQRRDAELGQRLLDEVPVPFGNHLAQVGRGDLGRDPGGHHDVDPVRPATGVRVHPFQHGVELAGVVEAHAAQHAEPARPADRGRDVLGRAEPDDRVLDVQQRAQRRPHGRSPHSPGFAVAAGAAGGRSAAYRRAHE